MSRLTTLSCSLLVAVSSLLPAAAVAKRMNPNAYDSVMAPAEQPVAPSKPIHGGGAPSNGGFAQPPPPLSAGAAAQADIYEPSVAFAPRRSLDRATVRAALVQARSRNLSAFRDYQKKGVFPSNSFKGKKLNVWLDADGHFCAAATIIKTSGQDDLVNKVAEQNNFIRLADVKQGPLMDWILTSGFTQDEIAAIQEPFMPVVDRPALEPAKPILVDAKLRKAEDARLMAKYKQVDKQLVKNASKSLDKATDRLMKNPTLAWQLIASTDVDVLE
ncbi:MAG TPA: hypothetical protein VMZ53_17610 [Kofleriaceae bacterium]|nr:hypothetical protein [Kofleriaceae bacterium]